MADGIGMSNLTPTYDLSAQNTPESSESTPSSGSPTEQLMSSFENTLKKRVNQVEEMHRTAQDKMQQYAAGEIDNVSEVTVAMQKADMGMSLMTMIRQKILTGFDELQQLQ